MSARLARLENAITAPRAPVTDPVVLSRITATENAGKSLADNVAALSRREDSLEAALRDTNAKIDDRIGKLAATTTELQTRARETAAGSDRASRLAVASAALRNTVERGDPYASELAIVKPLASDTAAIAALEPFAATGVPSNTALGTELATIIRPMLSAAGVVPRDGSYLEKLQASAEKLVKIRRADEASGDDRTAILSRIEQRAAAGNIAGALTELAKLSPDARAPKQAEFAAWTTRAQAPHQGHRRRPRPCHRGRRRAQSVAVRATACRICRNPGGALPPREGRVRAQRGGGEMSVIKRAISPPGSRLASLARGRTLPSRGGMRPPEPQDVR